MLYPHAKSGGSLSGDGKVWSFFVTLGPEPAHSKGYIVTIYKVLVDCSMQTEEECSS